MQQNIFIANYCFSQYFNYKEQVRLQFVFSLRRADFRLVGFVLFKYFSQKKLAPCICFASGKIESNYNIERCTKLHHIMNDQLKITKASQLSLEYGAFKYDSLKEFKFH